MSFNQSLNKIASIRFSVVGVTFLYYALAASLLTQEAASKLFLFITIITSIELFIIGAAESLILQKQYTKKTEKTLIKRQIITSAVVVFLSFYNIENICLMAGVINSLIRIRTAKARASNDKSAAFMDGLPQAILNILIVSLLAKFFVNYALFTPLLAAALTTPISIMVIKDYDLMTMAGSEKAKDCQASFAIYSQFLTSVITSLALGFISGSLYRELFLAQRFGDSMINFSRVLQWTKVERIRGGANALDFNLREYLSILGLAVLCATVGTAYGFMTKLGSVFFIYLPLFIVAGVFTVFLANLTQCLIQADSTALLLKIRVTQLATVIVGAGFASWMNEPGLLVIAAALVQISVYIYVKYQSLHSKI